MGPVLSTAEAPAQLRGTARCCPSWGSGGGSSPEQFQRDKKKTGKGRQIERGASVPQSTCAAGVTLPEARKQSQALLSQPAALPLSAPAQGFPVLLSAVSFVRPAGPDVWQLVG